MKLSLYQEALNEERKLKLEKLGKETDSITALSVLLPNYCPEAKQALFHASSASEKGIKGGLGSGKSYAFCAEAILLAFINRPLMIILSCATKGVSLITTVETLKDLLDQNSTEYAYVEREGIGYLSIYWGNDKTDWGEIRISGQGFLKGPNVAAVGFDEPFSQRKKTYENIIARARHPKAKRIEIFWAGTAEPDDMEWGFEFFKRDFDDENLFTITIATRENKHLPSGYVERLEKKYDSRMQEVYLQGKYVLLGANRLYHAFSSERNVRSDLFMNYSAKPSEVIVSFDFNVDPMCAVVVIIDKSKKIPVAYQVKEFSIKSSNTKELCSAIISFFENSSIQNLLMSGQSIIITGDASGRRRGTRSTLSDYEIIRDEFSSAKIKFYINVPTENPSVRDRINFTNKIFESGLFLIDSSCTHSITDRELVHWKSTGDGFIIDKSNKELTHLSDAGDYAVWNNQILMQDESYEQMSSFGMRRR